MNGMKKIIQFFIVSLLSIASFNSFAEFKNEKLSLTCNYFSENKDDCNKEIKFLSNKNKNNSVISYCYSNYHNLEGFNDCLRYEYNPLVFLKYKKERMISTLKLMDVKRDIVGFCSRSQSGMSENKCLEINYIVLEKSKDTKNWIENYCVSTSRTVAEFLGCISKIKKEAKSENNLLNSIPNLIGALDSLNSYYDSKRSLFFNDVYERCHVSYNKTNTFTCIEKELDPVKKDFIDLNLKTLFCAEKSNFDDYKSCILKMNN